MYIKKRLIAISAVFAIAASFSACSDQGSDKSSNSNISADNNSKNEIVADDETLSSEELNQIIKRDLSIEPFVPEVQQDAVESDDGAGSVDNNTSDNNNSNNSAGNNNNSSNSDSSDRNNSNNDNNNNNGAGNNSSNDNNNSNDVGNNNVDIVEDTGLKVIEGTPIIMQAYWMDFSKKKDYVFNGEYLLAQFKIKDDAANGIYPVKLNLLDFANWESETINFTGVDGAVVVGGEVDENKFNDSNDPQVMVANVTGKPGETVTVAFQIKNNPGVVINILRFSYNSDALEYVGGGEGADFNGHFQ